MLVEQRYTCAACKQPLDLLTVEQVADRMYDYLSEVSLRPLEMTRDEARANVAEKHRGCSAHLACPRCAPAWAAACVVLEGAHEGGG